jgi:hypothetical protein
MAKPALCTSCRTKLINGSKYSRTRAGARARVRVRAVYETKEKNKTNGHMCERGEREAKVK